jgi:phage FluMu gp28-like protein
MKGWAGKENRSQRTPAVLLPYQQKWIEDQSPVKLWEKSRRIGASWAEAGDDALTAASKDGMDVWYTGYNKDMALEFIEDSADWARHYNLAAARIEEFVFEDEKKDIQAFRLRFASGWKVVALSSRPSNLRGKQGKAVIDEAAFHDDLQGLLKAAIAFLMWGGKVAVISTHDGDENPFNELIGEIRAGKKPYSLHRTTLDEALAQGLYERICLRLNRKWTPEAQADWRQELINFYGEHADEELFCIPSRGSGIYLPRALIEACMDPDIPVLRWTCKTEFAQLSDRIREAEAAAWCEEHLAPVLEKLEPNWPTSFGEDFGRTGDLTVILPLQQNPGLHYRPPCAIELRNVPFRQQEQVLFYLVDRLPRFSGGALDARGNGQYLAEVAMQRYGSWRIAQVMLSNEWYRDNMPRYKAAFEDGSITLPKDADILDDHRAVRMEKGVAKVPETLRSKGRDGGQRHGDAAVAGALAWYAATTMEGGPIEYESVSKRRFGTQRGAY